MEPESIVLFDNVERWLDVDGMGVEERLDEEATEIGVTMGDDTLKGFLNGMRGDLGVEGVE